MTGLRTIWGVNLNTVKVDFGANFKEYLLKASEKYINEQLLYLSDNKLLVTQQGKFLCDGIASQLFKID
jgi:oxygen-independent coproporphyrinogen-3 oxidase